MVLSSAITIAGSQTIANDSRGGFPYDRRRSQNRLRSAIRDRLRSYGNQPLVLVFLHGYQSTFYRNVFHVRRCRVVVRTYRTIDLEDPRRSTSKCIVPYFDPLLCQNVETKGVSVH